MISIVLSGRNDNYGGDFKGRLFNALNLNLNSLDHYGIEYELIFVEWNPVSDRNMLVQELPNKIRKIVVDPLVHRYVSGNRFIQFYEFFAKNIGASRSTGDYVLYTNAEIILGEDTLDWMGNSVFDKQCFYRAIRVDLVNNPVDLKSLSDRALWKIEHPMHEPPYTNASGDFCMCHRELIEICGGYDETIRFTTTRQDGRLVHRLFDICHKCEIVGKVFHVDHERPQNNNPMKSPIGPTEWHYERCIPYSNGTNWGFRNVTTDEEKNDILYVKLCPELMQQALSRVVPDPIIPEMFR